jgi:hypothetical protein
MSTTGNEDQQPEAAPALGEPAPGSEPAGTWTEAPEQGGAAPAATRPPAEGSPDSGEASRSAGADSGSAEQAAASAAPAEPAEGAAATVPSDGAQSGEPSHEAVGIGVIDGGDHHGHDGGRDTLSVSEAQHTPGALGSEQEQRLPAMSQNNASDVDKVAGIVAQTRSDVGAEPLERIAEVLRQRLTQSGIDLPEHDVEELARQVSTGDADSPASPGREDSR